MTDQEKLVYAFREVFSGESGTMVMKCLAAFCGNGEIVLDSERKNCYMQGRFSVLREIKRQIERNPNGRA